MKTSLVLAPLFGLVLAVLLPLGAVAQTVTIDARSLLQRLDQLERRLQAVEAGGGGYAGGGGAPLGGDAELRMQDLERENSQLLGNVERLGNVVQQLARKVDNLMKDLEIRLQDIENSQGQGGGAATTSAAPEAVVVAQTSPAASTTPKPAAAKPVVAKVPAEMTPADHYNRAYAYLTAADYDNAREWLKEFIKRHPKDALGDNAYYWLGEVYLVQNNPTDAVKSFRDGLQAFPKGAKAPANLLKMGTALKQLKQPQLAKGAWDKLVKDHPKSVEARKAKDMLLELQRGA